MVLKETKLIDVSLSVVGKLSDTYKFVVSDQLISSIAEYIIIFIDQRKRQQNGSTLIT